MNRSSKQNLTVRLLAAGCLAVATTAIAQSPAVDGAKGGTPAAKAPPAAAAPAKGTADKGAPVKPAPKTSKITIDTALVVAIDDPNVSTGEAGILMQLNKKEGDDVVAGDLLGQIYDLDAKAKLAVAENELTAAQTQAESRAQIEVAEAAVNVTKNDYLATKEVFEKSNGAVSRLELEKKYFEWERAKKQVDVATTEHLANKATQRVKEAQVQAANNEIERRQIKSYAAGKVIKIYKKLNEWVRPEEPVMQVMRMDKVRVEGFADAKVTSPGELKGCPVEVQVHLAGEDNRVHTVKGRIDFVSPVLEGTRDYRRFRVFAEVENTQEKGEWLIQPGSPAKMIITVGGASVAPAVTTAAKEKK